MDALAEFGWRGRIGYIVAIPVIEHMPYEFYQMAPKGVGINNDYRGHGRPEVFRRTADRSRKSLRQPE